MSTTETKRRGNATNIVLTLIIIAGLCVILTILFRVSDRANDRAAQIETLTAQITALEAEKTALADELTALNDTLTAAVAERDAINAELMVAQTDLADANERLANCEATLTEALTAINAFLESLSPAEDVTSETLPVAEEAAESTSTDLTAE